jgi:oligoribonuclease
MNTPASSAKTGDQYFIWFDTEYSSLKLEEAHLLQVAALITDRSLQRVLPGGSDARIAVRLPPEASVSTWVEENIPDLVALCRSSQSVTLSRADQLLARYVDQVVGPPAEQESKRPILAGNSVHADWWLAQKYLPEFSKRLHFRHLDVTTLKLEWQNHYPGLDFNKDDHGSIRRYFPAASFAVNDAKHDAYYDVQASIAELAFYRQHLFTGKG